MGRTEFDAVDLSGAPSFDRNGLEAAGFTGFVGFDEPPRLPRPAKPGVYAVLREDDAAPEFLKASVAGAVQGPRPDRRTRGAEGEVG